MSTSKHYDLEDHGNIVTRDHLPRTYITGPRSSKLYLNQRRCHFEEADLPQVDSQLPERTRRQRESLEASRWPSKVKTTSEYYKWAVTRHAVNVFSRPDEIRKTVGLQSVDAKSTRLDEFEILLLTNTILNVCRLQEREDPVSCRSSAS